MRDFPQAQVQAALAGIDWPRWVERHRAAPTRDLDDELAVEVLVVVRSGARLVSADDIRGA